MVSSQLKRKYPELDVAIIEPSSDHYYQPAWTLVGGGTYDLQKTRRSMASLIPKGVKWIQAGVNELQPHNNRVILEDGMAVDYKELIVAVGIKIDYSLIPGLKEGIGKQGICTNYDKDYVEYTYECLRNTLKGNAVFTQAPTPIKCGGAPQKIAYLGEDFFRKKRVRKDINLILALPGTKIFGVSSFEKVLDEVVRSRNIDARFFHKLVEVRPEAKELVYEISNPEMKERYLKADPDLWTRVEDDKLIMPFEMVHLAPPQSAPDLVKKSDLADENSPYGWVEVDKYTLQHVRFNNVWSLGDVSSLPCAKTGASIRKQAPVLVNNLVRKIQGESSALEVARYNGYASCPIVTGYGKMLLAEFDYENNPQPSFPFNTAKERYSMWLLKKYLLPWLYWNKMMKGSQI